MAHSGFSSGSPGTVSGVFFTKRDADQAYNALLKRGHTHDDISVLMSDETLSKHEQPGPRDAGQTEQEYSPLNKATDAIADAIISLTSMISLPGLGIAISKTLFKRIDSGEKREASSVDEVIGARIPDTHTVSYGDSMKEGGIIISVDPRSFEEKEAIIRDFRNNNGHDILGDDGYTELD